MTLFSMDSWCKKNLTWVTNQNDIVDMAFKVVITNLLYMPIYD